MIELATLLIVALVVGTLVARTRAQAHASREQAQRMTALYELSQEISAALAVEESLPRITRSALRLLHAQRAVIRLTAALHADAAQRRMKIRYTPPQRLVARSMFL